MRYRRLSEQYAWHFCVNCPDWPQRDFEEQPARPFSGDLCSECQALLLSGGCEPLLR